MKKLLIYLCLIFVVISGHAQEKISIDGYLNDMQAVYHIEDVGWLWENQVHNRLNLNIYPVDWLKISIQGRTRFLQGNMNSIFPGYGESIGKDAGWIDATFATDGTYNDDLGYVFTSMLDRAYAEFTFGNFVGTVGRQRINWGQTFAWNPNDIFNSYSYFDVDYPERPGADAIRLQYYTGMASNIEVAVKIDSANRITAAGFFRFNAGGYDFQILGGILSEEDLVIGTGWSGSIGSVSFRGEGSYFHDIDNFKDTTGIVLATMGLDYTFSNSLLIQGEVLYSSFAKNRNIYNLMQVFSSDMSVKNLGFTEWSVFASLSYPITPLLSGSLAAMYYPEWKGFYLGPSFDISAKDNLAISIIFQGFSVELEDPFGDLNRQNTFIGYAKLKWSF
jgi:hypothetical protein